MQTYSNSNTDWHQAGIGRAWRRRAKALARWTRSHLLNRDDRHGTQWMDRRGDIHRTLAGKLDFGRLVEHFRADADAPTGQIIGLLNTSLEEHCKWLAIDIDNHGDASAEDNLRFALRVLRRAQNAGLTAVLIDSSGSVGGYHLWVLFASPISMSDAHRLVHWLARGWRKFGLRRSPDLFPRSNRLAGKRCGHWLRLPGRHHKGPSWSRVWSAETATWLEGDSAIDALLALRGKPVDVAAIVPLDWSAQRARKAQKPEARERSTPPPRSYEHRRRVRLAEDALCVLIDESDAYDSWYRYGMCLTELGGDGLTLYHQWSSVSTKCRHHEVEEKWRSFRAGGDGKTLGLGTLFHDAQELGWTGLRAADRWERYQAAIASGDPSAEEILGEDDSDQLADDARDARFARVCDEAVVALDDNLGARAELARLWRVSPDTISRLGVGLREDVTRNGRHFAGTGRVAWTIPLSSGAPDGYARTVGLLRVYRNPLHKNRLAYRGRHGLILPWDLQNQHGPVLVCLGAADTARALERGEFAFGLSARSVQVIEVSDYVQSRELVDRQVLIVAPRGNWGCAWARATARELSSLLRREVDVRDQSAGAPTSRRGIVRIPVTRIRSSSMDNQQR